MTDPTVPVTDRHPSTHKHLSTLPPRAQNLLGAARRLLVNEGFDALTWERVAEEAGEPKATIRYYFKNSDGLLSALLRVTSEESMVWLIERSASLPSGPERIHEAMEGLRELISERWYWSIFELLPRAMRDEKLRQQIADDYRLYRELNRECLGVTSTPETATDVEALAALFSAVADGIAIQCAVDPEGFDPGPVFALLERTFKVAVQDIERLATG